MCAEIGIHVAGCRALDEMAGDRHVPMTNAAIVAAGVSRVEALKLPTVLGSIGQGLLFVPK